MTEYPPSERFLDESAELIPETRDFEKWKKKSIAIAHCAISAARLASFLSPLQIGLQAFLHKKFASRKLIDVLSFMGFCSSYNETTTFEVSSIMRPPLAVNQQALCQMVYDNADFNIVYALPLFDAAGTTEGTNSFKGSQYP